MRGPKKGDSNLNKVTIAGNVDVKVEDIAAHRQGLGFFKEMHAHSLRQPTPKMGAPMGDLKNSTLKQMTDDEVSDYVDLWVTLSVTSRYSSTIMKSNNSDE